MRRKPARSSSANRAEPTSRLLGSARMTTCSDGSNLSMTPRAAWRNRRANRCRCTADPTDRETISPTFGASDVASSPRRTYITRSRCTALVPCLTVVSKSADRVMRFRAESTAETPGLEIKQSASDVPYDADSTPLPGLPWYASAAGSRARGHGAGYSAGTSACPLPRLSPRCLWHRAPTGHPMPVGHACPHEAPVGFVSRW
jgi:hypothetical protein